MKITVIDTASLTGRLTEPFNPPRISESFTEDAFREQWHAARNALKDVMDAFGVWNAYCEGDYFLDDATGLSRGIGIEVTNPAIFHKAQVEAVQKPLCTLDEDFEVHFALASCGLFSDIFVSRNEILTDDPNLIRGA